MQLISEEGMKNIDKVQKQKSKLSIQQLDETLLILYDRLTRINKYPVKDLNMDNAFYTDGVYTDDGSGIFDDFCMKLKDDDKVDKDSSFYYRRKSDVGNVKRNCFVLSAFGKPFRFPKREITTEIKRKHMAIWLASKVCLHFEYVSEEELEDALNKSEFCEEHDVIRWDLV